jgi:3-oxoadipate enol-lactonase
VASKPRPRTSATAAIVPQGSTLAQVTTHHEDSGSGFPVVLIHGLGASTAMWQLVAPRLAGDFRVVAYDLRGLGRSATPPPPYSLDDLVADLDELADRLGLPRFAVVGHSLGGLVAFAFAARRPERVAGLVAISAPVSTPRELPSLLAARLDLVRREGMAAVAAAHEAAGLPAAFREAHPELAATYRSIIASGDPVGYAALCELGADLDLTAELGQITAPALLVAGELDSVVTPALLRGAVAAFPAGAAYVELAGCGHIAPLERPDELAAHLRGFLAAVA